MEWPNIDFIAYLGTVFLKTKPSILTELYLDGCQITDDGIKQLTEALKQNKTSSLKFLRLRSNKNIGIGGISAIASLLAHKHCNLEYLNLDSCDLDDILVQFLMMDGLKHNKSLSNLSMARNYITDSGLHNVASALRTNCSLCELRMHAQENWGEITYDGAAAFVATLQNANHALVYAELGPIEDFDHHIDYFCRTNRRLKREFNQFNDLGLAARIAPCLWPHALQYFHSKPGLIYAMLKSKPDICREQPNIRRRSRSRHLDE